MCRTEMIDYQLKRVGVQGQILATNTDALASVKNLPQIFLPSASKHTKKPDLCSLLRHTSRSHHCLTTDASCPSDAYELMTHVLFETSLGSDPGVLGYGFLKFRSEAFNYLLSGRLAIVQPQCQWRCWLHLILPPIIAPLESRHRWKALSLSRSFSIDLHGCCLLLPHTSAAVNAKLTIACAGCRL